MQPNHTDYKRSSKPAMLLSEGHTSSPVPMLYSSIENSDAGNEFLSTVIDAAQNAGCIFLFEIPASLFDNTDSRAAAVMYNGDGEKGERIFIVCNSSHDIIQVLSETEVAKSVLNFVDSYANVLLSLNSLETCQHLH
jgi:hypothetical protein